MTESTKNTKNITGSVIASAYDAFQEVRISNMNRIRDVVRKKIEGIEYDEVEEEKDPKERSNGKYSDDNLMELWELAYKQDKISEREFKYTKKCFRTAKEAKSLENSFKKAMLSFVKDTDVYKKFLSEIRGIGPVLSAKLIKNFGNCSQYATVSKLWAHCGYHVVNGKAPTLEKGKKINFSPKLRTFVWKISDSLMKLNKGVYRDIYLKEKQKQLNKEYDEGYLAEKYNEYEEEDIHITRGHAHNRALRKMVKIFLDHYWHVARISADLEAEKNYVEGVLNHNHIITWRDALEKENMLLEK
jgi:hypothetical protein